MQEVCDLERTAKLPLEWLVCLRRAHAWMLILLGVDLAVLGDVITGRDLWFGPVYLLMICLAAWARGWRTGQAVGLSCMALTFAINGAGLYPYGEADLVWNLVSRFAAISMVVVIVAGARRVYIREWWLARTDPLTHALNRQAFFELGAPMAMAGEWRLLVYADIDGLKQLNDSEGHAAGDACLRAYAAAVRKAIRRDDMFARVGGDEFLVFMAVRSSAAAGVVASRLHQVMNSIPNRHGSEIRCSIGALIVPPGAVSLDEVVRCADGLMYQAKLRGACLQIEALPDIPDRNVAGRARNLPRTPAIRSSKVEVNGAERRMAGVDFSLKRIRRPVMPSDCRF